MDRRAGRVGRFVVGSANCKLRRSNVTVTGWITCPNSWAIPADPTLALTGTAVAGGPITLTLRGPAGSNGRLQQGNAPLLVDDGLTYIEMLCNRIRIHPLGPNASGQLDTLFVTPSTWPAGRVRVFQGLAIEAASNTLLERTNSVTVVVH